MQISLRLADGTNQTIEARKFCHYVENIQFWFAYHKSISDVGSITVTHIDSGNGQPASTQPLTRRLNTSWGSNSPAKMAQEMKRLTLLQKLRL